MKAKPGLIISGCIGSIFGILIGVGPNLMIAFLVLFIFICLAYPWLGLIGWLVGETLLGNLQLAGANPRTFLIFVLAFYLIIKDLVASRGINLRKSISFLKIPFFILFLGTFLNIIFKSPLDEYFRWFITLLSNLLLVLVMRMVIKNTKDLKILIAMFALILGINAIFGVLQYAGFNLAYEIRHSLNKLEIYAHQGRILGLARDAIEYAYSLQLGFCLFLGIYLYSSKKKIIVKVSYIFILLIIGVALILNGTRSAIGGVIISLLLCPLFKRQKDKRYDLRAYFWFLFFLISLALATWAFLSYFKIDFILSDKQLAFKDPSAVGRWPRLQLAFQVFLHNPLGLGGMTNYSKEIIHFWPKLQYSHGIALDSFSVHNHFMRAFLYFGILGGICFLIFMFKLLKLCIFHYDCAKDVFIKSILMGSTIYLVAYSINIFFHNSGPLSGDNLFWFWVGILSVVSSISKPISNDCNVELK